MKKIVLLIVFPLILIFLILFYFSDYLYSYREQKRDIYNEWLAYSFSTGAYFCSDTFTNTDTQNDKLKEIFYKYVDLKNESPWFDVNFSKNLELNDMLFEGLNQYELEDWAETHQSGDAFLYLSTLKLRSPFEEEMNRKKWLQKAVNLERKGAEYLLLFNEKTKDIPYLSQYDYGATYDQKIFSDKIMPIMIAIPGYKEFRQAINDGDYMLYKTLESFVPIAFHSEIRKELECHLREKAVSGNLTAQMQLGDLIFNPPAKTVILYSKQIGEEIFISSGLHIYKDSTSMSNADRMIEKIFKPDKGRIISKKLQELNDDIRILKQAANSGDRHAMYLWLVNAGKYCDFLTKEDWNDVFRFNEILLQEGHWKYMERTKNYYPEDKRKNNPDLSSFIWEYYSQQSVELFFEKMKMYVKERGKKTPSSKLFVERKQGDKTEIVFNWENEAGVKDVLHTNPEELLLRVNLYKFILESEMDLSTKQILVQKIIDFSDDGYPEAILALSYILDHGLCIEKDTAKAQVILEKNWDHFKRYNYFFPARCSIENIHRPASIRQLAVEQLMDIYSTKETNAQYPGAIFKIVEEYYEEGTSYPLFESPCYFMGLLYEKGIGVSAHINKAFCYYEEGSNDGEFFSTMRLAELCEKDSEIAGNRQRAEKYYRLAWKQAPLPSQREEAKRGMKRVADKTSKANHGPIFPPGELPRASSKCNSEISVRDSNGLVCFVYQNATRHVQPFEPKTPYHHRQSTTSKPSNPSNFTTTWMFGFNRFARN